MTSFLRNIALITLPVITLFSGIQIGIAQERESLTNQFFLQEGIAGVGSGVMVTLPEQQVELDLLWNVWRLLIKNYIEPERLQADPMVLGAISGMVDAIGDPYTNFMPPKENTEFRQALNGNLQGIGAELTERDNAIVIIAPLKGSPAERAGLLPEDRIIEVNGESTEHWTLTDAVEHIRGEKGTEVTLTILRESENLPLSITITRDDITVPSSEYEVKEHNGKRIGYIALNRFADRTTIEVQQEMQEFMRNGVDGIIVDVRFNGGGYLDKAIDLVSMFLEEGKVVSVVRRDQQPQHHSVSGNPITTDTPLVILINEGSASASEILAGALQDHNRATVIGKQSFGKGTVQEVFELSGGTSLRVTTAKWLTPNGHDLGKQGVTPDIEVDRTLEDIQEGQDPQLEKALEILTTEQEVAN